MNIAFITPEFPASDQPAGGLGTYLKNLSEALLQRNHTVQLFCWSSHAAKDWPEWVRWVPRKEVKGLRTCPAQLRPYLRWRHHNRACKTVAKIVKEAHLGKPFDLVQVPNYFGIGSALLYNGLFPVVCRISCYQPLWRSATGKPRSLVEYGMDWFDLKSVRHSDARFAPSQLLQQTYKRFEGIDVDLIPSPIPMPEPTKTEATLTFDDSYLIFAGTLNFIKGVDILMEALPAFWKACPEVHLVLAGRDDMGLDKHPLKDPRLHLLGQVGREELMGYMQQAQGMVLPSRVDNQPNVALEALACGTPIATMPENSIDELITHGESGVVASTRTPGALADAMISLVKDQKLLAQGAKQRHQAIQQENRVDQLVTYYEHVVDTFKKETP